MNYMSDICDKLIEWHKRFPKGDGFPTAVTRELISEAIDEITHLRTTVMEDKLTIAGLKYKLESLPELLGKAFVKDEKSKRIKELEAKLALFERSNAFYYNWNSNPPYTNDPRFPGGPPHGPKSFVLVDGVMNERYQYAFEAQTGPDGWVVYRVNDENNKPIYVDGTVKTGIVYGNVQHVYDAEPNVTVG
jgi:hypothetical protein